MAVTIIIFILVLAVIVLVHELGHYVAARKNGVSVDEFGIGFPPRALKLFKNKAGTLISLNWLPIGGFVKLKGEQGDHKKDPDSFSHKKPWRRAIILVAGVSMNVLLAIVLFTIGYTVGLPKAIDTVPTQFATITNQQIQIIQVVDNSPADKAGIQSDDVITALNGELITSIEQIRAVANINKDIPVSFTYLRDETEYTVLITPEILPVDTSQATFGISTLETGIVSYPIWYAFWMGIQETFQLLWLIITALATMIYNLFTSAPIGQDLVGPIGVAVITGKFVELGYIYVLQFVALISLNLAVINIIPFPALDGGRLLFLFIEKVKGSPVKEQTETLIHNVGFIVLLILVGIVTVRDIFNFDKISNLF